MSLLMGMTGQNGIIRLDRILFIDSSFPLELLNTEDLYHKIITFDFDSHNSLTELKIQHEISDTYLTHHEIKELQEKTLDLSSWSKQKEISQFLEYEGINVGNLTFNNFIDFIAGFLKKFCEIQKIIQQNHNCEFVCSTSTYEMAKIFSNNVKIKKQQASNSHDKAFKHTYHLGKLSFQISLTKEKYLKLKNLTESIFSYLFRLDKPKNNNDSILCVEFDPIKYKTLFLSGNNAPHNFILYNRRRPLIWNLESLNVIRKSKCQAIVPNKLLDSTLQTKITEDVKLIGTKLDELWNNDFFETFFSINKVSFWSALRHFFSNNLACIMKDLVSDIALAKKLLENQTIKTILILSEIGPQEQILMHLAHINGKKVVLLQHGIPYETREASKRNNLHGFFPNFSDAMIVWGPLTKQYLENAGILSSKLKPLGNSPYDDLVSISHNAGDTILLATSPPMKDIVYDNLVITNQQYRSAIKNICQITTKLNKKLVIKLHPSLVDFDIESITKKINKDIQVVTSGSIFPLISNCNLLITFDLSTSILEAQILQKPTISITLKDYGFGDSDIFKTESCIRTTIDKLEQHVDKLLIDDSYRRKYVENGNRFVEQYLSNRGTATKSIHDFLKDF